MEGGEEEECTFTSQGLHRCNLDEFAPLYPQDSKKTHFKLQETIIYWEPAGF